jgi:hypothetical protein
MALPTPSPPSPHAATYPSGQGPPHIEASQSHLDKHHTRENSGRVISPTQRPQADNTQH